LPIEDSAVPTTAPKGVPQRSQRKAKSHAISKMDHTRERESTVPPSTSSASSVIEKASSPKASLLPSMSSNLTTTSGGDTDTSSGPKPSNNPILKKAHVPRAPPLDRKSVKWSGPRNPKPQAGGRHFGLEECPTFYPTAEEFQDPMEYLRKIGDEGRGKEFGMCKVVPPQGWQMPFVLDTEVSHSVRF
jgi:histone demethylase JARID1